MGKWAGYSTISKGLYLISVFFSASKTKVFLKYYHQDKLEDELKALGKKVIQGQKGKSKSENEIVAILRVILNFSVTNFLKCTLLV